MIRLRRSLRHDGISFHRKSFGHQELKLASLVSTCRETSAVISLDPDLGAAKLPT
jgi:hypothetical protein